MHTILFLVLLTISTALSSGLQFNTSALSYENGTAYSIPQAITLAISPTNPDLLLAGSVLGTISLLRIKQATPSSYVVKATEDVLSVGEGRNLLGITADPFNPTIFFISTVTIAWKAQGLGPAGWQNGKVQRIRLDRKKAKLELLDDLITGIPVSALQTGGGVFGVAIDSFDSSMYVSVSSMTSLGVSGPDSENVPDSILASVFLKVDIRSPKKTRALKWTSTNPLDAKLIDPSSRTGIQVFASGIRSVLQPVFTTDGRLFGSDAGASNGTQYSETCSVSASLTAPAPDKIIHIKEGLYYGTPNRARGLTDPNECVFIRPGQKVDPERFPRYEPPKLSTKEALERGDLLGGITGLTEYTHGWFPELRGKLVASGFETPYNADLPESRTSGIVSVDVEKRRIQRIAEGAGGNVAVDITGTMFTTLTTSGQIGVVTPVVSDAMKAQRRVTGVWPARGQPGSRVYIVGTRLPSHQKVFVGGVECTMVRRLRRYPVANIVSCRVPRLGEGPKKPVDVQIGALTMKKAFMVL